MIMKKHKHQKTIQLLKAGKYMALVIETQVTKLLSDICWTFLTKSLKF